jgi:hypothetical protein
MAKFVGMRVLDAWVAWSPELSHTSSEYFSYLSGWYLGSVGLFWIPPLA